jgi:hypothetical protein
MKLLEPGSTMRFGRRLLFVVSAALVALAIHQSLDKPWLSAVLVVLAAVALVPPWLARRRFRRLLLSGDAERVVEAWREALDRAPHQETIAPLIAATAFASYGWVKEARVHLQRVRRGPGWDASAEHRLFVETLLEAFDGDREQAMKMADAVASLPMPPVNAKLRRQVLTLRASLGALARAFAHRPREGDLGVLEHVARSSPLVSWAMRYAAAIVAVDRGEGWRVPLLLYGAPSWPPQSAFRQFHDELIAQLARQSTPGQGAGAAS